MLKKFSKTLFCLLLCASFCQAQNSCDTIKLSSNWDFLKSDLGGIWEIIREPQLGQPTSFPIWEKVELPHCFNAFDAVDPSVCYYQGPGWYRNFLEFENPYAQGHTIMHFDGAGQKTEVYIGFTKVGEHVGGYDEWEIDITEAIEIAKHNNYIKEKYEGKIPVAIRCDNSRDLETIPSDLSDFHIYGGIYRNLYIEYHPGNWINRIKIDANVDTKGKKGEIEIKLENANNDIEAGKTTITIVDPTNAKIFTQEYATIDDSISISIAKPQLWSPNSPLLYTINIETSFAGKPQKCSEKIGFRNFEFIKDGPFMLNGERLLLKGTHRHEDFAGVAAAETDEQIRSEMKMIKELGVNFIRLGHYQQSPLVLDLCDSLGILVWEEIPWCRGGLGGSTYKEQARRMLTNMIEQHYNHTSVILWGLGNENDWPGDTEIFSEDSIRTFMSELNTLAHHLDPYRKTSIRRCDFCKDIVDVYSPSIWAGWYRGRYTDYLEVSKHEKEQVDRFLHVEWGADSHVGRHSEELDKTWLSINSEERADERAGDASLYGGGKRMSRDSNWSESYAAELFDWTLSEQSKMPWLTGTAFWIFKDFATPIRPENPIPYVNQKGVVERDLTPKETYYVVQSHWATKPMVHIYGHSWPIRWGNADEPHSIKVYSNCDEVELFINGKSLGTKKRNPDTFPAQGLTWDVYFEEGQNQIKAIGSTKNEKIADEINCDYQVGTWGTVDKLLLEEVKIDDNNSYLKATAIDANGLICLDSKLLVEFDAIGDAKLVDNLGTSTGSRIIQLANGQAKIRITKTGNAYSASVKSEKLGCFILK